MKKFMSVILAMLMAFCSFSAFAANEGETLMWYFDGESDYGDEYYYEGELQLGENAVTDIHEEYYSYYDFNAETAGYYLVTVATPEFYGWVGAPERIEDGSAYLLAEAFYLEESDESTKILLFLSSGKNVIGIDGGFEEISEENKITVEYFGESITSIELKNELPINYDIWEYSDENEYEINANALITFSSGKTVNAENLWLIGTIDGGLKEGENQFDTEIAGNDITITVTAFYSTSYIKDVTITNIEKYLTVYENYNDYSYDYPYGETATVTMADGSTQSVIINSDDCKITLPNGESYWLDLYYNTYSDDAPYLEVYCAGSTIKKFECKVKKASLAENFSQLVEDNDNTLSYASYYFDIAMDYIGAGNFESAKTCFEWALAEFVQIFINFFMLIEFYI